MSASLLEKLQMSKIEYHKALKRLKMQGLLEKRDGIYYHSMAGCTLYRQVIELIAHLSKHQRELKIVSILKKTGQFSDKEIRKFIEQVRKADNHFCIFGGAVINNSYEDMVVAVRERVELAPSEILIATRIYSDEIIASLIFSVKRGVKVRVLVDEKLIAEYRRVYFRNMQKSGSQVRVDNHGEERIQVVEDPWYHSGVKIERRVGTVPFSLIILDRKEVGIESVNSQNPNMFTEGIAAIGSSQICDAMLKLYEKWWANSHSV